MVIVAQVLCVLLGAFFLVAGWMKIVGTKHMVHEFDKFNYPHWLRVLTGCIEAVAAPMMLAVFWFPAAAALGSLIMCPVMVGAAYTNFVKRPPAFGWGTVVILVLCAVPVAVFAPQLVAAARPFLP